MTDEQLVEMAEEATSLRLPGDGSFGELARRLVVASGLIERIPDLVEELREARRLLAKMEPELDRMRQQEIVLEEKLETEWERQW